VIRVAYILTPVDFGGAEKVSLTFLRNVDRTRFDICPILLIRPWENGNIFMEEIERENYQYLTIPVAIRPLKEGKDYFRVIRCFTMLFSILKGQNFDLVHTNGYFADIIGVPASRLLGIPHIATCHGFISNDRNLKNYNKLDIMALRFTKRIIAVSEGIKNDLISSGVKRQQVIVLQNAVELSMDDNMFLKHRDYVRNKYHIRKDEIVLGYIGRISEEKGLRYLMEAGSKLIHSGVPLKIMIVGDGPQKIEMEKFAQQAGLQNKVIFAGFQKDIETWLPSMDVFVLPSLTEGTPMALLESMACGIPVIATRVGGVPKVIESGINGILVDPADPVKLYKELKIVLNNHSLRKRMAQKAIDTIKKKHSINDWCRKIEGQYNFLAQKKE
jgi:glycosyltransferase involved in cell wall biosynthesis